MGNISWNGIFKYFPIKKNYRTDYDCLSESEYTNGVVLYGTKLCDQEDKYRGAARLQTSDGQERNISSFFLILLLFSPIFPQFFLIFFLNLVLWVCGSSTWEGLQATPLAARPPVKACRLRHWQIQDLLWLIQSKSSLGERNTILSDESGAHSFKNVDDRDKEIPECWKV